MKVHDAVFQSLAAIARRELGPEQRSQIALPVDTGVAARWAALSDKLPRAQRALESLGYRGCWTQAWQELDDVTNEMCKLGVVVCDGCLLLTLVSTKSSQTVPLHTPHTRTSHSRRGR